MIWRQLTGHEAQVEMFRRAIARGRLAHAYLLIGPRGIGKGLFARLLCQCLACERVPDADLDACGDCPGCRQMRAGTHPDLIRVGLPEGKRELPINLIAGERGNRSQSGLCHDIALAPMAAGRRMAIIDDADAMNEEAANALLKTLEEPPPGAILLLLTPDSEPILPTIRSRCQPVRFEPLREDQLHELLRREEGVAAELGELVGLAEGSLEVARQLLDPGMNRLWRTVRTSLDARPIDTLQAIRDVTTALDELGSDTASQRQNLHWALRFAVESLRAKLATTADVDELDCLGDMLDRCCEAELHLQQTMPVPLCLEALYAELGRRSRAAMPARP